jgi:hypothetical protein
VVGLFRQAMRRAGWEIADIEISERAVDDLLAVRRDGAPAQHFHRIAGRRDLDRNAQRFLDAARSVNVKRNRRHCLRRNIDAADVASGPEDDRLVVRRPRHRRIEAVDGPRLLHVAIEAVVDRRLFARLEIEDEQRRFVSNSPDERERLSIRRRRRPNRAAGTGDERLDLAGLPIQSLDDVDLRVGILVVLIDRAGRRVVAVIEVAAVGRQRGLAGVFLLRAFFRELQPFAAAAVIEPDLARAEGALGGEVLAGDEVLGVGRPVRLVEQAEGFLRHLLRLGAVAIHDPDVVAAGAVTRERDPLSVRRVARLHVPGDAGGQGLGIASRHRNRVDVAEEVEGDLVAVRTDIERKPRALGHINRDVVLRAGRVVDIPLLVFFFLGGAFGGDRIRRRGRVRRRRRVFLL